MKTIHLQNLYFKPACVLIQQCIVSTTVGCLLGSINSFTLDNHIALNADNIIYNTQLDLIKNTVWEC